MIGGHPVSARAREEALGHLHEMHPTLSKEAGRVFIDDVARHLEADLPSSAMLEARTVLDLTGAYRLLAVLAYQTEDEAEQERLDKLEAIRASFAREAS